MLNNALFKFCSLKKTEEKLSFNSDIFRAKISVLMHFGLIFFRVYLCFARECIEWCGWPVKTRGARGYLSHDLYCQLLSGLDVPITSSTC